MYKSLLFLFALVSIMSSNALGADNSTTSTVKFDEDTYVVRLADDIRVIREYVSSDGEVVKPIDLSVVLQFHNDGVTTSVLYSTRMAWNPISTYIKKIQYADPTHVWILSRLGHMASGAALVDTLTGDIIKRYEGQFKLRDDGGHITTYLSEHLMTDRKWARGRAPRVIKNIFIDDHLIFPELRMNEYVKYQTSRETNKPWIAGYPSTPYQIDNMHWEGEMFRFVVREVSTPEDEMQKAYNENRLSYRNWLYVYRVQGRPEYLGGKGERIEQVSKTELSPEELKALQDLDNERDRLASYNRAPMIVPLKSK